MKSIIFHHITLPSSFNLSLKARANKNMKGEASTQIHNFHPKGCPMIVMSFPEGLYGITATMPPPEPDRIPIGIVKSTTFILSFVLIKGPEKFKCIIGIILLFSSEY